MQEVSIRELVHNFSHYLKDVKEGERITILERRNPVADIIPHNRNIHYPGWKRMIRRKRIGGEAFSSTIKKIRENE
jgi:antitoxin (DNA-binding transcriptional repressor) of toxin-antitoxin stability system